MNYPCEGSARRHERSTKWMSNMFENVCLCDLQNGYACRCVCTFWKIVTSMQNERRSITGVRVYAIFSRDTWEKSGNCRHCHRGNNKERKMDDEKCRDWFRTHYKKTVRICLNQYASRLHPLNDRQINSNFINNFIKKNRFGKLFNQNFIHDLKNLLIKRWNEKNFRQIPITQALLTRIFLNGPVREYIYDLVIY